MTTINTTAGPRSVDELGRTLIHEHVAVGFPGWFMDARQPKFRRDEAVARAADAFQALHAHGVRTVVDPCPMDLGRDVELIAEVSQRSGVTLVCATGAYYEAAGITYTFGELDVDAIAEIYIREIEEGIGETGIKAGLIKIATGDGQVTDYERKLLTAAARAAKATGAPLLSHTENASCGHDQIDIVCGEGVAPERLVVGHSDGRDDPDYQRSLADRGAYVGFDRFGLEIFVPDEVRERNLVKLVEAGHRDRVLVSHDTISCWKGSPPMGITVEMIPEIAPNWRLTYLFEDVFPRLRELGLSDADLDHIVGENPRRFFAGVPA